MSASTWFDEVKRPSGSRYIFNPIVPDYKNDPVQFARDFSIIRMHDLRRGSRGWRRHIRRVKAGKRRRP